MQVPRPTVLLEEMVRTRGNIWGVVGGVGRKGVGVEIEEGRGDGAE